MFDQSFSVKNFRIIFDKDRINKGSIEIDHFPEAYRIRNKINMLKKIISKHIIRNKQGKISDCFFESRKSKINDHIEIRKKQYNEIINRELFNITETVNKKGYILPLCKLPYKINDKNVFSVGKDVETIFVTKHIQYILNSIYKINLNNRDTIISRLSNIVRDKSPKYIVRADIDSFYESIKHKNLLNILHSSPILSVTPRRILTQLIRSYGKIIGSEIGIPRGVGISAYLSEIYMSSIDKKMLNLKDIIYYERYVDDIIIVFSPTKSFNIHDYLDSINLIIEDKELKLNDKTKNIDLFSIENGSFEYLGYKFVINNGNVKIKLSSKKIQRNKKRIDDAFKNYDLEYIKTRNRASKNLLERVKFLTGNTRLHNSKSNAFVGIYFSNKYITDTSDLYGLDQYLKQKIRNLPDMKLSKRLDKLSFEDGFNKKVFRSFSMQELSKIARAWKYG